MPLPQWATDIFVKYTLGELQSGPDILYPVRIDKPRSRHIREDWPFEVRLAAKRMKGTGIPASTLHRIKTGQVEASKNTLKRLRQFVDRINYARMRASGASATETRKYYRTKDVNVYISKYRSTVQSIAKSKDVNANYILWGLMQSGRPVQYWDYYTKAKGYETPEDFDDDIQWHSHLIQEAAISDFNSEWELQ